MFENIGESLTTGTLINVIIVLILVKIFKSLFEKRHVFRFARNYGGYKFYPIIGNGYHIIGKNIFTAVQDIIKTYGLPCNMWLGHDYHYITANASEIKIILNHPNSLDKIIMYNTLKLAFNNTLLVAPVDVWKKHRKFYSKSFSQPILNTLVRYFYKNTISLLDVLKNAEQRDVFEIFERYTFDSFCESIIGIEYNMQLKPKAEVLEWIGELQSIGGKRLITYFYYPTIFWIFSREGRRVITLIKWVKDFIYDIIREKRKAFAENPVCVDSNTPLSLLDAMLQAEGEKFSDRHIFKEMFLFSTAATDTSGYTLAYTFTLLGMHREIQERVYHEVMSVVGGDRPIYHEDLPNLKYTERAISEAMRILPVTPVFGRLATADIDLGTKVIPKGTNIIVSAFNLHRNEKYWPDPLVYDPDRFLPEEVAKREPYSFLPFSGGPRNCIGKTYSIMLMKTVVANVVRNYEISSVYKSVEELNLTSCITMKTTHPLDCRFKPRMHD